VNNKIYAIGGSFGSPNQILSSVEEYDPATDTWTKKAEMSTKRFGPAACVMDGKIYAISGAAGYDVLPIIEKYDQAANTWISLPNMPIPRAASACVINSKIYYIGGALTVKPPHPSVSTVEEYTPSE
jgi:N-acetylneuraminic acid mutarotase